MSAWSIGFGSSANFDERRTKSSEVTNRPLSNVNNNSNGKEKRTNAMNDGPMNFERMEKKPAFCSKENFLNSVAYINQELELLGYPILKIENGRCTADMFYFMNRLHDLLVLYHKTSTVKEDLETKNHKLSCESNHHQAACARQKRDQEQVERELAQEKEKTRQVNLKIKQMSNKLKAEREEVKRLTAVLQYKDIQQKHDNKKKEKEIISLKERLHHLLADKVPDRKVGMDLMNVLSSGEGRRGTWKPGKGKQEEEMYHHVITGYEERHRELMIENSSLRDCLLSLQRELSGLLKRTGGSSSTQKLSPETSTMIDHNTGDESIISSHHSMSRLDEGYIQMPFDIVRKEIEKAFKETCSKIGDGMQKSLSVTQDNGNNSLTVQQSSSVKSPKQKSTPVDESEMEKLKRQIITYKDIIHQQEQLIQKSLQSHSESVESSFVHESQLLKEKENLSEQKKLFFEEKSGLEKERCSLAEMAKRLSKERQALQEERTSLLRQYLTSPMKENQKPRSKGDGQHLARLLPPTPVFSPSSSKKGSRATTPVKLPPSTQELSNANIPDSSGHCKHQQDSSPTGPQILHPSATIHFTPRTSSSSLSPPQQTQEDSTTSASSAGGSNAASSMASIRASLARIKKSASQLDT